MSSLPLCPFFIGLHFTSLPLPPSSSPLCRFITSSSFSHPLIFRTFTNLSYTLLQQPQNCPKLRKIPAYPPGRASVKSPTHLPTIVQSHPDC